MDASVITYSIPYYSGLDFLKRAIESVLAQEESSWQCVVIDDSSESNIEQVVKDVGRGRVRYVKNPTNLGIGGNFNRSIDVAETELVTVLHADDELMPNYTTTMLRATERHPKAAAIYCCAQVIGPQSQSWFSLADIIKASLNPAKYRELSLQGEPGVRALLRGNFIVAPALCFRKSVLGDRRFATAYKFVLDWEFTTRLLLEGETLVGLPDVCIRYRRHFENATEKLTKTQERYREESEFYDRMGVTVRERGWDKCAAIAADRRMMKLNIAYRTLKSVALLKLDDARKGLKLLREM